jgi:hypothetical protein
VSGRVWIVVLLLVSTSCASQSDLISVAGVGETSDGSTLQVVISPADVENRSCWADVNITPVDEPGFVRLDVRGRESHTAGCATPTQLRVRLPTPLGSRTVRDGASGQPVSFLPVVLPEATWLPDGWVVRDSGGSKDGWSQSVGIEATTIAVEIDLFRTGTSGDLRGSTITSPATVQGRNAAFVKERYRTSGPEALLMMDASWSLMIWSYSDAVTTATLQRIADGLTTLPFAPTIDAPTIDAPKTGTVAELIDYEGPTILTGWLSIDATEHAQFCEALKNDGRCNGATVDIDWSSGSATPPTDLISRGDRKVSDRALTLAGTLKGRMFYVGL